jgi:hypothetical protein
MNPKFYYHTPTKPVSTRANCPVCHQTVYSRAGIHPQCAVIQSDPPRLRSRKPQVGAEIDQSLLVVANPAGEIVVELAPIKRAPTDDLLKAPAGVTVDRPATQRSGARKGTWAGLVR